METKELLRDFSTEDLANEIKRRKKEARAAIGRKKTVWFEWTGVVRERFKEHLQIRYVGYYIESDILEYKNRTFYLKLGVFNKKTMPKVGDTVVLAVKIIAADKGRPRICNSKITKIIKHGGDDEQNQTSTKL